MVKERNPITVIIIAICTCSLYYLYWLYVTSEELVELGATLPPAWYAFIPGLNIYFMYKYLEEWHRIFKYEQDLIMVFIVMWFIFPLGIYWVQTELNTKAK